MGLCKCPKRKVTNQFCFEHRVNVCEHCMVNNHPKCIVQSYLKWLQDSDYEPVCGLCRNDLGEDECVRLVCYHVFHWHCLDRHGRELPDYTAPAGFRCPSCSDELFPKDNLVSPVADALRSALGRVNWARQHMGLQPVEDAPPTSQRLPPDGAKTESSSPCTPSPSSGESQAAVPAASMQYQIWLPPEMRQFREQLESQKARISGMAGHSNAGAVQSNYFATMPQSSNLHFNKKEYTTPLTEITSRADQAYTQQQHHSPSAPSDTAPLLDSDDNKYRRRSAVEWLHRWIRSVTMGSGMPLPKRALARNRRIMLAIIAVLAFATIVLILSQLGRSVADDDPSLDPMYNPNIRVMQDRFRHNAQE